MTYADFDSRPQERQPDEGLAPPMVWAATRETNTLAWVGLFSSILAVVPGVALLSGGLSVAGLVRSRRIGSGLFPAVAGLAASVVLGVVSFILVAAVALPALNYHVFADQSERTGTRSLTTSPSSGYESLDGTDLPVGSADGFLEGLKEVDSDLYYDFSDSDLLDAADFVCGSLDDGVDTGDVLVDLYNDTSFTVDEAATVGAIAVIYYCPEHAAQAEMDTRD